MPLLNEPNHKGLIKQLSGLGPKLGKPSAIVVISAHWEEPVAAITSASSPELIYDYHGFPEEAYRITYPAPGNPALAGSIAGLIRGTGGAVREDAQRGLDHGAFVPLKLMYPDANIPVVQLSLLNNMEPRAHLELGKAIAELSRQGVLIIGSGFSFHNMGFSPATDAGAIPASRAFDSWLNQIVLGRGLSWQQREQALIDWERAPHARYCHPREEHLLPLFVCFGAARVNGFTAENIFDESMFGAKVSSFMWC